MVVNKSGRKGRKKKASQSKDENVGQKSAGVEKSKSAPKETTSSDSSDKDSEFLEDDSSLDSDRKSKRMLLPSNIDFAGLPEEPTT